MRLAGRTWVGLVIALAASLGAVREWRELRGRALITQAGDLMQAAPHAAGGPSKQPRRTATAGAGLVAGVNTQTATNADTRRMTAEKLLVEAVAERSVSSEAWTETARLLVGRASETIDPASDTLARALEATRAALDASPTNTKAWLAGYRTVETGRILGRTAWLPRGEDPARLATRFVAGALHTDPNGADLQHHLGALFVAAGELEVALPYFRRAASLSADPVGIAREMLDAGYPPEEIAHAVPQRADAQYGLGRLLLTEGHGALAEEALLRAGRIDPALWETWTTLSHLAESAGRHAEALAYAKRAFPLFPKLRPAARAEVLLCAAAASRSAGDSESAIESSKRAIENDPRQLFAYGLLASLLYEKGDPAGSIRYWQTLLDTYPNDLYVIQNVALFHRLIGRSYEKLGMREHAIEHYRAALAARSTDTEARNGLARLGTR